MGTKSCSAMHHRRFFYPSSVPFRRAFLEAAPSPRSLVLSHTLEGAAVGALPVLPLVLLAALQARPLANKKKDVFETNIKKMAKAERFLYVRCKKQG